MRKRKLRVLKFLDIRGYCVGLGCKTIPNLASNLPTGAALFIFYIYYTVHIK